MKIRSILYYLFIIIGGIALGYWVVLHGKSLESVAAITNNGSEGSAWQHFVAAVYFGDRGPVVSCM